MADFQTALRAVSKAASFAIPWNHSFSALEGFLHASNFCAAELANRPNRAALLTAFVNHVFGINAKKWSSGMVFLGADDLRSCWLAFFGTRSASVLTASGSGHRSGSGSGNGSGFGSGSGSGNGSGKRQFGRGFQMDNLCRRYNAGNCPDQKESRCLVPGTTIRLDHLCNKRDANNVACKRAHPAQNH